MKKTKHLHEMMKIVLSLWALPPKGLVGNPRGPWTSVREFPLWRQELKGLYLAHLRGCGLLLCRPGAKCFPGGWEAVRQQLPTPTPAQRRGGISSNTYSTCVGEESLLLGCSEFCNSFRPVFKAKILLRRHV